MLPWLVFYFFYNEWFAGKVVYNKKRWIYLWKSLIKRKKLWRYKIKSLFNKKDDDC